MSDDNSSNSDNGGDNSQKAALGKQPAGNSKSVKGEIEKGTTADGNAGEEGGYGFIRPSAESDSGGSGDVSSSSSNDADE